MALIDPTLAGSVDIESLIAAQNQRATKSASPGVTTTQAALTGTSFAQTLRAANVGITLSGHAQTRLTSRQIDLTDGDYSKLSDAMNKAAAKGAKSSLVLMNNAKSGTVGLVVSIPNRTVITAVDTHALKENLFTNIDSAMIL